MYFTEIKDSMGIVRSYKDENGRYVNPEYILTLPIEDVIIQPADAPNAEIEKMAIEDEQRNKTKQNIITRLAEIDTETIRPLRATLAGTQTEADTEKLLSLEAEAAQLRANLKG